MVVLIRVHNASIIEVSIRDERPEVLPPFSLLYEGVVNGLPATLIDRRDD